MTAVFSCLYRLGRTNGTSLAGRIFKILARSIAKVLLRAYRDPLIRATVGRRELLMNWSHNLPMILAAYPNYETEIGRLALFLHRKSGYLKMIDVGANIGDTIAQLPDIVNAKFLCVEGSGKYFDLLNMNYGSDRAVSCVHALVSDGDPDAALRQMVEGGGTGHMSEFSGATVANIVPVSTVDSLLRKHTEFARANLLKIDTDGFDFRVIKGASQFLAGARPTLHFELSFEHWERFGGTNVAAALASLSAMGYYEGILYDNNGFLIGTDSFSEQRTIKLLHAYALRRKDFYLNVIAFHGASGWGTEFFANECDNRFRQIEK